MPFLSSLIRAGWERLLKKEEVKIKKQEGQELGRKVLISL